MSASESMRADVARQPAYRPDIDGLRAIAVLGVMLFHAGLPGASGGFVGVDVFFVISGYLITGLLAEEFERSGQIDFKAFFVRRIRRLLPALALVVTATLAIAVFTMFPLDARRLGKSAQAVGLLIANIHFKNFSGGYFDPSMDIMPLLHTWSLAVEEQYYLAWPLLFWLAHRLWKPNPAQPERSPHRTTIVVLIFLAIASFIACVWMSGSERGAAFYLTPYRAWEFALGALLAHGARHLRNLPGWFGDLLCALGLLAVLGTMTLLDDRLPFPGAIALLPVLGTVCVIAGGGVMAARLPNTLLGNRPLAGIGLISYSLYLWHWPLLALARDFDLGARDLPRDLGLLVVAFLLAWLSYRYVENPIRQKKPGPFASARGTFWIAAALSFIIIACANGVMHWSKGADAKLNARYRNTLKPLPTGLKHCDQKIDGRALPDASECTVGKPENPLRVVVWGDSHAGHLTGLIHDVSTQHGISALTRNFGACPPLLDAVPYKRSEGQHGCARFNQLVIAELQGKAGKELRGVILGARWNAYMALPVTEPGGTYAYALARDQGQLATDGTDTLEAGRPPLDSAGSAQVLRTSLRETLEKLTSGGLRVVVVAPVPELYFNAPLCLYRRDAAQCSVSRSRVEARRRLALAAIQEAVRDMPDVRLVDPINEFCDATRCYSLRNGLLQYGDDNHISADMSIQLARRFNADWLWVAGIDSR